MPPEVAAIQQNLRCPRPRVCLLLAPSPITHPGTYNSTITSYSGKVFLLVKMVTLRSLHGFKLVPVHLPLHRVPEHVTFFQHFARSPLLSQSTSQNLFSILFIA